MESLQKDKENQQKHEEEEMRKELERMPPPPTITLDEIMYIDCIWINHRKGEKSQTPEDEQALEEEDDADYQKFREAMMKQVRKYRKDR